MNTIVLVCIIITLRFGHLISTYRGFPLPLGMPPGSVHDLLVGPLTSLDPCAICVR